MKVNLEEAIKYLRHYIEIWSPKDSEESRAIETVLQALEKLQQDNYKLDRENQLLFESQINVIPKEKIENKLEELKEKCGGNVFHIQQTLNAEIRLLEELLEEK